MNDGVIGIVFSLVYVSLKEFGVVGSDTYTWGIKCFHKCWSGSLAKRRLCLGPAGVTTSLHYLHCPEEFVSWNAWLHEDFPGKSTGVGCHCLLRQIVACTLLHRRAQGRVSS